MQTWMYVVAGVLLLFVGVVIGISVWSPNKKQDKKVDDVDIKNGMRYSRDEFIVNDDGSMKVSHIKGDIIVKKGESLIASRKTGFKPGKYTVLSTFDSNEKMNIRLGGYVHEFKHGDEIIVGDGESICPVSCSIILR